MKCPNPGCENGRLCTCCVDPPNLCLTCGGSGQVPDDAPQEQTNPKDLVGRSKVDLSLLPDTASVHGAHAMMDGARKYGPYNWRDKKVKASVYVSACRRHLAAWYAREECAPDSGVHHLGHAVACLAILLDAQLHDTMVDDRPPGASDLPALMSRIAAFEKEKAQ